MDAESLMILRKILKDSSYSMTVPRRVVCDLLTGHEPQSMRELTERSRGLLDRASLYRTIALFEKLGIVQRIYIGWKYKIELSDIFSHHHHHASCLGCGRIVAITEDGEIEQLINNLAARYNFSPQNHQLEIRGYCAQCQSK